MKRSTVVGLAVTVLFALTGCSNPAPVQTPSISASESTTANAGKLIVPRVTNPLDLSKFEQNPCNVLTPAQASQVANLTTSSKFDGNVAPLCSWSDTDHNRVTFGFVPGNGGLTTSYKNQDNKAGTSQWLPISAAIRRCSVDPMTTATRAVARWRWVSTTMR